MSGARLHGRFHGELYGRPQGGPLHRTECRPLYRRQCRLLDRNQCRWLGLLRQRRGEAALGRRLTVMLVLVCGALGLRAAARGEEPVVSNATVELTEQPITEQPITEADREHWSFRPLRMPPIPDARRISEDVAPRGPIDSFILNKLQELDLTLAPPAEPQHLLRRLCFDLTGLPPTPGEVARFSEACASSPDAYERQVDRLLASPALGEHMAQSWLDLARFAETDGFEHDKVRPEAWSYRDWVIGALNEDMPYDHFMRMQVAGDLIDDASGSVATMFCLAGPDMPDVNDQQERRHNLLNEMTGTVGAVLLGLQLGCAACHDHKFDPLSQADFYRLRGVLESGVAPLQRDKPWTVMREQRELPVVYLYQRGDHRQATIKLARSVPRIAADEGTASAIAAAEHPRLALASWLSSSENPLPARTMVNRIWQSHFGRALAATPSDLGLVGIEPTHVQLLDWLACQLTEGEWSQKRLRRQVILSATYRQSSLARQLETSGAVEVSPASEAFARRLERDPDNRALSRYPRRRLTGEMLRDAMLAAADTINRRSGGPSVMPPLPSELLSTLLPGQWKTSPDLSSHYRRSIYVFARRNLRYPIFDTFDRPDAGASCPERGRSVTATQSLLLFNSDFSRSVATALANQAAQSEPLEAQADRLWQRTLGRHPSAVECELLSQFVSESPDRRSALIAVALALLNSNEFVIID